MLGVGFREVGGAVIGVVFNPLNRRGAYPALHGCGFCAPGRRGAGSSCFGCRPPDTGNNRGRGRRGGGSVLTSGFGGREDGWSVIALRCGFGGFDRFEVVGVSSAGFEVGNGEAETVQHYQR